MPMIREKLVKTCQLLKNYTDRVLEPLRGLEAVECGYKVGHTPPAEGWQSLGLIHCAHKPMWIRGSFTTPEAREGTEYILKFQTGVEGWDAINPQGMLYLNGKMVQGIDTNHMEAFLAPGTGYEMRLYLYTGNTK